MTDADKIRQMELALWKIAKDKWCVNTAMKSYDCSIADVAIGGLMGIDCSRCGGTHWPCHCEEISAQSVSASAPEVKAYREAHPDTGMHEAKVAVESGKWKSPSHHVDCCIKGCDGNCYGYRK